MHIRLALLAFCLCFTSPLSAQSIDELKAQLEAQKQINDLLKQRIKSLEAQVATQNQTTLAPPSTPAPRSPAPAVAALDPEEDRALERALVRQGSAVLSPGVAELTPSFGWVHSGRDILGSNDDRFIGGLDARVGMQNGWMLGAGTSLQYRDIAGLGDNSGQGDTTLTVWKDLTQNAGHDVSIISSLQYLAPTGDDFTQDPVPLGSGFHQLTGRVSAVKTIAPVAFFGDVSYRYSFPETFNGTRLKREGAIGVGLGATLAVTPDISASTGLRYEFEDDFESNGATVPGTSTTSGTVELGLGVVLRKDVFLNINGSFGITDDAPDSAFFVSLPLRF